MKRFIEFIRSAIPFIFQYLILLGTILASLYFIVTSIFIEYDNSILLKIILSLLCSIALSIVTENFLTLRKIENTVEKIQEKQMSIGGNIDELFIRRMDLNPLEERFKNSSNIFISGGSLSRLSDEYYGFFEQKLADNASLEVILVKPYSTAANMLCQNVVYETEDEKQYSQKITESLKRFINLKEKYNKNITIRLTENIPPYSIIALNLEKADAVMQVELYSYAVPTRERVEFIINKKDSRMYNFFIKQIEMLQGNSEIYESSTTKL